MTTYKEYVDTCRWNRYGKQGNSFWDVNVFGIDINGELTGVNPPENYEELLDKINRSFSRKVKAGKTKVDANGIAVKINDALSISGVQELGEHFAKELGDKLYDSECYVAHVHPYYLQKSDEPDIASWMWHYDNCAPGMIKIMVYLNDTTKENGAMEILKCHYTGVCPMVETSRISPDNTKRFKYPKTRIPKDVVVDKINHGYEEFYCEGPKGTFLTFNTNIFHKGTVSKEEEGRRCVIFLFRPWHKELDKHIGEDMTYGWECPINCKAYDFEELKSKKRT